MDENQEIIDLRNENEYLKNELMSQKSRYKTLSTELGQSIFENEDLDLENRKLKKEIEELEEEIKRLKKFKQEVESSTSWKVKKMFK